MSDQDTSLDDSKKTINLVNKTCREGYSTGQIFSHNIPLMIMYILGVFIVSIYNIVFSVIFIVYIILSLYIFMVTICAYCPHYGTKSSLCGYGLVTKSLTSRKKASQFKSQFRRNIAVLFPVWFVPLIFGLIIIINEFTWFMVILLIVYIIIAFGVVLYVSRSKSCKTCKLKKNCPWNSLCGG